MDINDFSAANLAIMQAYPAVIDALGDDAEAVQQFNAVASAVVQPERVSQFFEFIFARHETMPAAVKAAAADVGHFASINRFYGLGVDRRGELMERVLRGGSIPSGVSAPAPIERYQPADVPEPNRTPVADE